MRHSHDESFGCYIVPKFVFATIAAISIAVVVFAQTPTLSDVEGLKLQILQLKVQLANAQAEAHACRGVLGQYQARVDSAVLSTEEAELKKLVERNHDGWSWDPKTNTFTKKPDPEKPEKKE